MHRTAAVAATACANKIKFSRNSAAAGRRACTAAATAGSFRASNAKLIARTIKVLCKVTKSRIRGNRAHCLNTERHKALTQSKISSVLCSPAGIQHRQSSPSTTCSPSGRPVHFCPSAAVGSFRAKLHRPALMAACSFGRGLAVRSCCRQGHTALQKFVSALQSFMSVFFKQ